MQGHIHKRVHQCKDGRQTIRWYVVLEVGKGADGRRRQKWHGGFGTRREAQIARAKLVSELHSGVYTPPTGVALAGWIRESWLPVMQTRVKATTLHSYERALELHVLPSLGSRRLQELTAWELTDLYGRLARDGGSRGPLSPKTVCNVHTTVHCALGYAVDAGVVGRNVARQAKPPRPSHVSKPRIATWSASELAVFLDSARETRLEAVWRLIAMTGMRRGEVLGLRWADFNAHRSHLSVRSTVVLVGYQPIESTPKSHQARVIDLDEETTELLGSHRRRQDEERQLWGVDYAEHDLVVAWENGSPIHPSAFSEMFRRLAGRTRLPRIRLHDLRHTHATLALGAGVPTKVVTERLGHQSPGFTLTQYAHVIPGMQAGAAAAVARIVRDESRGGPESALSARLANLDQGEKPLRLVAT